MTTTLQIRLHFFWRSAEYIAPSGRVGLSDDSSGGWVWQENSAYGLVDDGQGGWEWSDAPIYHFNTSFMIWE